LDEISQVGVDFDNGDWLIRERREGALDTLEEFSVPLLFTVVDDGSDEP